MDCISSVIWCSCYLLGVEWMFMYRCIRKCMHTFEYHGVVSSIFFANRESFDHELRELANSRIHELLMNEGEGVGMHGCMIYVCMIP